MVERLVCILGHPGRFLTGVCFACFLCGLPLMHDDIVIGCGMARVMYDREGLGARDGAALERREHFWCRIEADEGSAEMPRILLVAR